MKLSLHMYSLHYWATRLGREPIHMDKGEIGRKNKADHYIFFIFRFYKKLELIWPTQGCYFSFAKELQGCSSKFMTKNGFEWKILKTHLLFTLECLNREQPLG